MEQNDPIAVFDWGTTNLRVHVVDAENKIIYSTRRNQGVKQIDCGTISWIVENIMQEIAREYGSMPCILVGMVGSNFGWYEVPMLAAPLDKAMLSSSLFVVPDTANPNCKIVPGIVAQAGSTAPGMMRGEETQVIGAMAMENIQSAVFCLPGTHTKWVSCNDGNIVDITTSMTGEVFDLLCKQSVLHSAVDDAAEDVDMEAFDEGVVLSASGHGALQLAFSTRARSLTEEGFSTQKAHSFLSGIMIGAEVVAMANSLDDELLLVGETALCELYRWACASHSISTRLINGDHAVAAGASSLYRTQMSTA